MNNRNTKGLISVLLVFSLGAQLVLSTIEVEQPTYTFIDFYDFKNQFQSAQSEDKGEIINQYLAWQEGSGFPAIINSTNAVFVYYSPLQRDLVQVAGDFNGWSPDGLIRIESSFSFFYTTYNFEATARLDYKLIVDGNWVLDPRNSKKVPGGFGDNSELAMPEFIQPEEILFREGISRGDISLLQTSFSSANPTVQVYTPANYETGKDYPTIYFADGSEYLNFANTKNVLDNLIADNKIQPTIAIFTNPFPSGSARHLWYDCGKDDYVLYLDELIAFIDLNYKTDTNASSRIHIGASLGGQITLDVGLKRSNLIKNLGIHSGAFWDGDSSLGPIGCQIKSKVLAANTTLNLRGFFTAGTYEPTIFEDSKVVEQTMIDKGWAVESLYVNEGHSWGQWRHTLDDMLRYFLPPKTVSQISVSSEYMASTSSQTSSAVDTSQTEETRLPFPLWILVLIPVLAKRGQRNQEFQRN